MSVLDGTGNLAGASSSGSVVGSRRMISEQPSNAVSHHSIGGQGGHLHGSHLHHNSQGQGQGHGHGQGLGPSDLNSRDSSTIAGSDNSSYNYTPNQPTLKKL